MRKLLFFAISLSLAAATIKVSYRATATAFTVTALNSLANSSSWSGAMVDNTSTLDVDEQVTFILKTASSGVSAAGFALIYAAGCSAASTSNCTEGAGTQGTVTLTSPTNLVLLGSCNMVANTTTYKCGPYGIAQAFGGKVPAGWAPVVQNVTGAAFASSGSSVIYDSIQLTSN